MITSSYHPITKVYKYSNIPNKLHESALRIVSNLICKDESKKTND